MSIEDYDNIDKYYSSKDEERERYIKRLEEDNCKLRNNNYALLCKLQKVETRIIELRRMFDG